MENISSTMQYLATALFAIALIHTFACKQFLKLAHRYPEGSIGENFFHLLGEVEVVFGFWAGVLVVALALLATPADAITYLESRNFTEPAFVFVIMTICSTRPVLVGAEAFMNFLTRRIPGPENVVSFFIILTVGPLLGSLITEPAAMTVTALLLLNNFFTHTADMKFKYAALGLLFVNISIGGTLTSYAAPPVLMVASTWQWDTNFMWVHFGWKAVLAILICTTVLTTIFRRTLNNLKPKPTVNEGLRVPFGVTMIHLLFISLVVLSAHHMVIFLGLFLFFLGLAHVTKEYQNELQLRQGLLVGFFLAGLVVLGGLQQWWLQPLLASLDSTRLLLGSTVLTAFTDNAALTYLGSLVPDLPDAAQYSLVAGAVTGGGLTVIANAPNPAGFRILSPAFGEGGISGLGLFAAALPPTLVALACFWLL